jgi:uncharacterized membrane protein
MFKTTQVNSSSYVYLRSLNIIEGVVVDPLQAESGGYFNLSDISLSQSNRIYSNGASDIYFTP